ncbi:HTH deoR-type domain-containing protein [Rubrivivax sp. A210]|uniref:helix-turn-helix transcriptional regulator n=1 Tax=Rubrivivax sp. A210 TaxID=2772301 RepID=UPI0019185EB4|nr:WYL domain-containing protein [Rubrivivax sp. A210]CAD5369719.1 HTH deoR-type domain-containing protein [Rubrivivax sp. A210]
MTKTARVYKIERIIRNRGHISFQALIEELEVSPATLKRDLAYLKDQLGAPIEYDRDLNGYRFGQPFRGETHELPGLWFSEHELYSLLMANQLLSELDADGIISRHLQPLLDRIHQLLGPDEANAASLLERVRIINSARRPVPGKFFELVVEGLLQRRRIRMRYLTRSRDEISEREVSPQRMVHHRNTWYLDAWCHRSAGLRRFALDAIAHAELVDARAKEVGRKTLQAEMDAGYGIYAGAKRLWATLSFDAHAARWISQEEWHREQKGRWTEDGRWELQVPYTDETELVMDILRHGGQVKVLAPASLQQLYVQRLREALAAQAGEA